MVQELCCDRIGGPDHHFRHVLGGQGAQVVSSEPTRPQADGRKCSLLRKQGLGEGATRRGWLAGAQGSWVPLLPRSLGRGPHPAPRRGPYPAGQHAQGPLVKVHDGVVLPLVVVDLLGPQ